MNSLQQQILNDSTRQGFAPINTPILDFQWGELPHYVNPVPAQGVLVLQVPRLMARRKMYCFMYVGTPDNTLNYFVRGSVSLSLSGANKGPKIPYEIGNLPDTTISSKSLVHFSTGGTVPYPDSLSVNFSVPWGTCPTSAVLIPHYFNGEFDTISFDINEVQACSALKLFLACESNQA